MVWKVGHHRVKESKRKTEPWETPTLFGVGGPRDAHSHPKLLAGKKAQGKRSVRPPILVSARTVVWGTSSNAFLMLMDMRMNGVNLCPDGAMTCT